MTNSVKNFILSTVFPCFTGYIKENPCKNGFTVGDLVLSSCYFESLIELEDYLNANNVHWYVTMSGFDGINLDIPSIRFCDKCDE